MLFQLFFQALYASTSAGFGGTVMFASTASLLSAIASLLAFCIERTNDHDMMAVQYYLALEKQSVPSPVAESVSPVVLSKPRNVAELSTEETTSIFQYRGLRLKLSRSLTQIWHS